MIYIILLIAMLYCHILDDFCLQGILASLKQKSWWEENYPNKIISSVVAFALIGQSLNPLTSEKQRQAA